MQENHRRRSGSRASAALAVAVAVGFAAAALALTPGAAPPRAATDVQPASFARDMAPIFGRWCTHCHGAREPEANLRLDSYEGVLTGGDAGPPVIAGDPDQSLLVAKIEHRDRPVMPPRKRLPKSAVSAIRAWIAAGALP